MNFFQCLVSKLIHFEKLALKEPVEEVMLHSDVCLECFRTFGGSKVQLNSWWKGASPWSMSTLTLQANLIWSTMNFFQYLIWKFIDFEKIICKKAVNYNTWYSWNCSQCHLALWTNHFVNRTFRESNWRVVESLIASDQAAVWKRRPILSKGQWIFFQCLVWRFIHFEEIVFEGASWWCHFTLKELLRLSCGLANRSFCRSDI